MAKVEKLNLYQKLHQIQKAVSGLGKDSSGQNYQYVSGSKVLSHIKPFMNELGLLLKQEVLSIENTRQDYATRTNPNKSEISSKVMMRFTWIDVDSGEKDENNFGANGQNDWDKGVGSALTYAERYFLLKYFHIATDEDDIDNPNRKPDEVQQLVQKPTPQPKAKPQEGSKPKAETPKKEVKINLSDVNGNKPLTDINYQAMVRAVESGRASEVAAAITKYLPEDVKSKIEGFKKIGFVIED